MSNWPSQRFGKRKQETEQLSEMEIYISPMFKWLGRRSKNRKQKTRQLWETEFNIVKEGLDGEQVVNFVSNLIAQHKASQEASAASLRSPLETAVADVEQVAASIKMKAQTEAEDEAARIINQAKQEADEIRRAAEAAAQKQAEDVLSALNRKTEITEAEVKQKVQLFLLRAREEIEKEVEEEYKQAHSRLLNSLQNLMSEGQNIATELKDKREKLWESSNLELKEYEATLLSASGEAAPPLETSAPIQIEIEPDIASKEKVEQPVQLEKEVTVSEPAEAITEELPEQHLPEERPGTREPVSAPLKLDSQALYAGEVDLAIAVPVNPAAVSKLYTHLQMTPEIKILYTRGSWDRGTTITVTLDKPLPLIDVISKIPGIEVVPELPQKNNLVKGTSSSLLGAKRKGVARIDLTLKEV